MPQRSVDARVFTAHQILDEVGPKRFNHVRQRHRVRHVEFRVEVNAPGAILANALAYLLAKFVYALHVFEAVDYRATCVGRNAVSAEACIHTRLRYLFRRSIRRVPSRVAFHVLTGLSAEQLIDRHAQSLALQIP